MAMAMKVLRIQDNKLFGDRAVSVRRIPSHDAYDANGNIISTTRHYGSVTESSRKRINYLIGQISLHIMPEYRYAYINAYVFTTSLVVEVVV